jgi:hypothetical protein
MSNIALDELIIMRRTGSAVFQASDCRNNMLRLEERTRIVAIVAICRIVFDWWFLKD